MTGVGSSPALATCETSHVLLAGMSSGFPGVPPFRPTFRLTCLDMSEIILKGTLNRVKINAQNSPRFSPNVLNGLKLHVVAVSESPRFFSNYYCYSTTTIHANVSTVLLQIIPMHHDSINRGES